MNDTCQAHANERATTRVVVPRANVREDEHGYHFAVEMPGATAEKLQVTFENGVLTFVGDAHVPAPEGYRFVRREFADTQYRRAFRLPIEIDAEKISAELKNGVLEVRAPKTRTAPRKIAVAVG